MSLVQLEQANSLTISIGNSLTSSNPTSTSEPGMGFHVPNPVPQSSGIGWITAIPNLNSGALTYSIKNESGTDCLRVEMLTDQSVGKSIVLKSPDEVEVMRLVLAPGNQLVKLQLPSGEVIGDLVVETKVKKPKKEGKQKKDKDKKEKSESEKKDKTKKKKQQYVLRQPNGQDVMKMSLKSKNMDKFQMKIKSLQRKGEVYFVESLPSTGGTNNFHIVFESGSAQVANEKLFATAAIMGMIEMESANK